MTNQLKVAVVYGGKSEEHDVSRASAAGVLQHLDRKRFNPMPVYVTTTGIWEIDEIGGRPGDGRDSMVGGLSRAITALRGCDVVFPVMHGRFGEDGVLQAFLEMVGVPYVGSGVLASAVCMDKAVTKRVLTSAGIAVADGVVVTAENPGVSGSDRDRLGLPAFVKPARSGSSIGVSRLDDWSQLDEALVLARKTDDKVLVEAAVRGREIDIAVLEHPDGRVVAGPPLEIGVPPGHAFFDYDAKYADRATMFRVPADLAPAAAETLQECAVRVFHELGCRGQARVDFFLRDDGTPVVNEINTAPGLTAMSQVPRVWAAAGLDYGSLLTVLIDTALTR